MWSNLPEHPFIRNVGPPNAFEATRRAKTVRIVAGEHANLFVGIGAAVKGIDAAALDGRAPSAEQVDGLLAAIRKLQANDERVGAEQRKAVDAWEQQQLDGRVAVVAPGAPTPREMTKLVERVRRKHDAYSHVLASRRLFEHKFLHEFTATAGAQATPQPAHGIGQTEHGSNGGGGTSSDDDSDSDDDEDSIVVSETDSDEPLVVEDDDLEPPKPSETPEEPPEEPTTTATATAPSKPVDSPVLFEVVDEAPSGSSHGAQPHAKVAVSAVPAPAPERVSTTTTPPPPVVDHVEEANRALVEALQKPSAASAPTTA